MDGGLTADDYVVITFDVTASDTLQTKDGSKFISTGGGNNLDTNGEWIQFENVGVDVYLNGDSMRN